MKSLYSRRDVLKMAGTTGLGLGSGVLAGCGRVPGNIGLDPTKAVPADGYKALVCVFLHGGNDGYSLLVPMTPEKHALYSSARLDLAIPREQLLALPGTAADGAQYGLHPACDELHRLFGQGRAALLANTGTLSAPVSRSDFQALRNLPAQLFSHNDQQDLWHSAQADFSPDSGWAGRMADVFSGANGAAILPMNVSLAGSNLLQTGNQRFAFGLSPQGALRLDALDATGPHADLRAAFDRIRTLDHAHAFERRHAATLSNGVELNATIAQALETAPELTTVFANTRFGNQLKMAARLISVRAALGMRRQVFFVSLGGFDTHDAQSTDHPALLQQLSEALATFDAAMSELGVSESVTAFTASDFGRSLTVNGKGTDHGWSNHHVIVGGAVRGGRIYGTPPSLVLDGSDDSRGGRFIPSTSVDEYAATLARWFGIGDSDLGYVLPNLGRFATRGLDFV